MNYGKLHSIRGRVEAQRSRYGARWNQILRDRADLLAMVDGLLKQEYICKRCGLRKDSEQPSEPSF